LAYSPNFLGGVNVAVGDTNGDGRAEIITSPGAGLAPRVKIFSGANPDPVSPLASLLAYVPSYRGGVLVAAGDVNGDGHVDIITAASPVLQARIKVFSGASPDAGQPLASFVAGPHAGVFLAGVQDGLTLAQLDDFFAQG